MKKLIIALFLLTIPAYSSTISAWNGVTVGTSSGNISSMDGKTIGTSSGNYGAWNGLSSPGAAGGTPTVVNNKGQTSNCGGGATCATQAFASPLTNGSTIIACSAAAGNTTITWTDTAGNTYADSGAGAVFNVTLGGTAQCGCANNTHTTSSNVVTAHDTNSQLYWNVAVEYTGVLNCTKDVSAINNIGNSGVGGGQNLTSGSITPTQTNDLIISYFNAQGGPTSAGTGYTNLSPAGPTMQYKVYNSTTTTNPTGSDAQNSDPYVGITYALKHN